VTFFRHLIQTMRAMLPPAALHSILLLTRADHGMVSLLAEAMTKRSTERKLANPEIAHVVRQFGDAYSVFFDLS
jgi:hypothetical protein